MAVGIHWEWRGFGAVSGEFAHRFGELASLFPSQDLDDVYLWVSGLEANVKVRPDIPEEPFKFKRLQNKEGNLEQWDENPEEIYEFPLNEAGWNTLAETLATVNVAVGPYPSVGADAFTTLVRLLKAGVRTVTVEKLRESRQWKGPHGLVKVEWVCISLPQAIISIGLETWHEDPEKPRVTDAQAKEDISAAIEALGLDREPLKPMNYLDAVAVWASGEKL